MTKEEFLSVVSCMSDAAKLCGCEISVSVKPIERKSTVEQIAAYEARKKAEAADSSEE